jgi:uncharacterized protein (TIGR03083 family)
VTSKLDLGADYRTAREEVAALIRTLAPEQLAAEVPACPGWSVHDVVSHLTGVANDAVNGRLRGMPEPAQTAAQVAERAATPTSIVLREWERTASQYEAVLSKASSSSVATVVDVVVHEQDIRGAVGLPGNRANPLIDRAVERTLEHFASKVESAGLPAVVVRDGDEVISGSAEAPVAYRTSVFEAFRAVYGRRSRSQIERRFSGADEPGAYVPLLCVFGPAEEDIIE